MGQDEVLLTKSTTLEATQMKGNKYKYEQQNKRTTKKDRHSNKQETELRVEQDKEEKALLQKIKQEKKI